MLARLCSVWFCGLLMAALGIVPQAGKAQRVDTASDPYVTLSDSVNMYIRLMRGIDVVINKPRLITTKGYKLKWGHDIYYMHVVRSKDITINGAQLANRSYNTYLIICTDQKKIEQIPPVLESRAMFIKAFVDRSDSLRMLRDNLKLLRNQIDSLGFFVVGADEPDPELKRQYDEAVEIYGAQRNSYELYREFKKYKKPNKLVNYFLSHHFRNTLKYNVLTFPTGLPHYYVKDTLPPIPEREKLQQPVKMVWRHGALVPLTPTPTAKPATPPPSASKPLPQPPPTDIDEEDEENNPKKKKKKKKKDPIDDFMDFDDLELEAPDPLEDDDDLFK